jgi:predicted transcriptional regulator
MANEYRQAVGGLGARMNRLDLIDTLEMLASGLRALMDMEFELARREIKLRCELYRKIRARIPTEQALADPERYGSIEYNIMRAQREIWNRVESSDILAGVSDAITKRLVTPEEVEEWTGEKGIAKR